MSGADDGNVGSIILNDLKLFNRATMFFESEIDPYIRDQVRQVVSAWIKDRGWKGRADVTEDFSDMWLSPAPWDDGLTENDWIARFQFGFNEDLASEFSYDIADIFGVGATVYGFRFHIAYGVLGGRRAWNAYAKGLGGSEHVRKLGVLGWTHEGGGIFFLPVTLPADKLAAAWENDDWRQALIAPLTAALTVLEEAAPIFSAILDEAKTTSSR